MLFPWSRRLALGGLLLLSACRGNNAEATLQTAPDAGPSGAAGGALAFRIDPSLACPGGTGVCAGASQPLSLGLVAAQDGTVSLGLGGTYEDAALTADSVQIVGGQASFTLQTPSTPAVFTVVAREGGQGATAAATLSVTVSESGFATVRAIPSYAGLRDRTTFEGTDLPSTCAEIRTSPPPSSTPWTRAPDGVAIALTVPAGERIAIDLRIGHYAFGCADVDPLGPGTVHDAPVTVLDVPMALAKTSLSAKFYFSLASNASDAWHATAAAAAGRVKDAYFAPGSASEGTQLLDAMRASITPAADQAQFDQLRTTGGWDGLAQTWLGAHVSLNTFASNALDGAAALDLGPLVVHIGNATSAVTPMAPVAVTTLTGLPPTAAAISPTSPFTLAADADDTVHLSGAIDFATTPYVAHLADARVASAGDASAVTDVPSALAGAIDCAGLAKQLVGAKVSHGTCDAACTGTLCATALSATWAAAAVASASNGDNVHFAITASAPCQVGDTAEPLFVQGGWLGQASGAGVSVPFALAGELVATEHAP